MPRLVGRDAPLGELRDALRQAQQGRGGAVVVHGEARMGKTRLAEAVADEARASGLGVLWCLPQGRTEPGSAATGTLMRPPVLRSYVQQAGWLTSPRCPLRTRSSGSSS